MNNSASDKENPSPESAQPGADDPAAELGWQSPKFRLWVGLGAALFVVIYFLRLDQAVGHFFVDDAYYVLLAKALATGQGYHLINTPSGALMPLYPPAFPALLSIAYRLAPSFPENLWMLKLVSIAAMFGAGVVSYFYFARLRQCSQTVSLGIALTTALTPGLVMLATSTVMSECVYTLAFLAALLVIEVALGNGRPHPGYLALGGALSAFAFLTRSAAIALVAAALVYLLKEKLWRALAVYVIVFAALVGPWQLYMRAHAPTAEQRKEQEGYIVTGYAEQFWQVKAGDANSGVISPGQLPARVWNNLREIAQQDLERIFLAPLAEAFRGQGPYGVQVGPGVISLILFLLMLLGFVMALRQRVSLLELSAAFSLGLILLWPWDTFRYTITLTPVLLFYLLMGLRATDRWRRKEKADTPAGLRGQEKLLLVTIGVILAFGLFGHLRYLFTRYLASSPEQPAMIRSFEENLDLLNWVKGSLPQSEILAAHNPPLVYLYTGNKTISSQNLGENQDTMRRFRVRHLVLNSAFPLPNPDLQGGKYKIRYRASGELNLLAVDFGPPESQ